MMEEVQREKKKRIAVSPRWSRRQGGPEVSERRLGRGRTGRRRGEAPQRVVMSTVLVGSKVRRAGGACTRVRRERERRGGPFWSLPLPSLFGEGKKEREKTKKKRERERNKSLVSFLKIRPEFAK